MDIERALVSKIVTTGQVEEAVSRGIREDLFADDEARDLFGFLTRHMQKYKTPPSISAVKTELEEALVMLKDNKKVRRFPTLQIEHVEDALEYVTDRFINLAKRRLANEMVLELAAACDDPERSKDIDLEFLEVSRKLATLVPSTKVSKFKEGMEARIDAYEKRAKDDVSLGVPFGFPTLDSLTGGMQAHEFITVAGFSGLGKSTFLMVTAFNAFMQGYTPLYISLEMEAGAILRKWDAMAASLDYSKMKQLKLPPDQLDNWRDRAREIQEKVGEIPVIDSIRGCTPTNIYAETVRHKPDVVIVDYLSLMRSSHPSARGTSLWQAITEITQDLKQNARTLKIPVLAAAQTNRGGAKEGAELDNIGNSISIVQDSDIVIGLFADDEMKQRQEMEIRLNKNRDGGLQKFKAVWDHENMIFRQKDFSDEFGRGGAKFNGNARAELA